VFNLWEPLPLPNVGAWLTCQNHVLAQETDQLRDEFLSHCDSHNSTPCQAEPPTQQPSTLFCNAHWKYSWLSKQNRCKRQWYAHLAAHKILCWQRVNSCAVDNPSTRAFNCYSFSYSFICNFIYYWWFWCVCHGLDTHVGKAVLFLLNS